MFTLLLLPYLEPMRMRYGEITYQYVCGWKQILLVRRPLAQVIGLGHSRDFVPWQRTTQASLCGTVSFGSGLK